MTNITNMIREIEILKKENLKDIHNHKNDSNYRSDICRNCGDVKIKFEDNSGIFSSTDYCESCGSTTSKETK